MIKSYIDIYQQSNEQGRLDILKRFLDKMFPQYDFSGIDNYDVIFTRDKFQFYIGKECVCALYGESRYISQLVIYKKDDDELVVSVDKPLTTIIYDLLEIEDGHR